jgi:hypothetical protein
MDAPEKRNALILLFDGLNPALLSACGCTWIETPAFDQLAAESVVFERAVTETVDRQAAFGSFLAGRHPLRPGAEDTSRDVIRECRAAGIHCRLLTDEAAVLPEHQKLFDEVVVLADSAGNDQPASNVSQTHMAASLAAVLDEVARQTPPCLVVVWLTGLSNRWDAPLALREKYRDEGDPPPLEIVIPPTRKGDFDPDEILGVSQAYAAQLESLDTCLGAFFDELQQQGLLDNTLFMLGGLRGFPLGQQRQIGHAEDHVTSDATCVPLFVRPPNPDQASITAARCHALTSPSEWLGLAVAWLRHDDQQRLARLMQGDEFAPGDERPSREFVAICENAARAIWTPAWLLVDSGQDKKLFVKPDDRWDVNPVHDRCRGIAEDLTEILHQVCQQLREDKDPAIEPLADELVFGLE